MPLVSVLRLACSSSACSTARARPSTCELGICRIRFPDASRYRITMSPLAPFTRCTCTSSRGIWVESMDGSNVECSVLDCFPESSSADAGCECVGTSARVPALLLPGSATGPNSGTGWMLMASSGNYEGGGCPPPPDHQTIATASVQVAAAGWPGPERRCPSVPGSSTSSCWQRRSGCRRRQCRSRPKSGSAPGC